jgi:DNA-directed RNA polymerase specialized sigma24 family protein
MAATAVSDQVTPEKITHGADHGPASLDPTRGILLSWLLGIAHRKPVDLRRELGRHYRAFDSAQRAVEPSAIEDEADRVIARFRIPDVLASPSADRRRMLEISAMTDAPLGTVHSHIRRDLARLKARWEVDDASRPRPAGAAGTG